MNATTFTIQSQVSLAKRNTFGIDAIAKSLIEIDNVSQLQEIYDDPRLRELPRFILGGGSNVILSDEIDCLVLLISLAGRRLVNEDHNFYYVSAAAGESWHQFVLWTLAQGYAGLENLSLIPGTVGAAPIQNIGAYGIEIQDYFHSLQWFDFETGEVSILQRAECQFGYRDSIFKHAYRDRAVVLEVTFALPKKWSPRLAYADLVRYLQERGIGTPNASDISNAVIAIRQSKLPDPAQIGNAGSFFKNPVVSNSVRDRIAATYPQLVSYPLQNETCKLAAGWLIEHAGWKGRTLGHAGVYEKQALVLVNRGGATGQEVRALAQQIQADVQNKFGVELEIEPVFC